jgi:hypothetical protein
LRWDFVFQRPQHLMSRFANDMTVVFWEEPIDIGRRDTPFLQVREAEGFPNVRIVVPHLPEGTSEERREASLKRLLDAHVSICTRPLVAWYYTPMMLEFSRHIDASVVIYDCMDELSKFRFAPEKLLDLEQELIDRADLVFTGVDSATGLTVAKRFTFRGGQYEADLRLESSDPQRAFEIVIGPRIGDQSIRQEGTYTNLPPFAVVGGASGKTHIVASGDVKGSELAVQDPARWAGVTDNYFAMLLVKPGDASATLGWACQSTLNRRRIASPSSPSWTA